MSEEKMVGSRLPAELLRDLEMIERVEQTDRSTTVRKLLFRVTREWKVEYFARQYAEGKLGAARAAHESGVSLWEMMEYLRNRRISAQYDLDEWQKDVVTVHRRIAGKTASR